MFKSIQTNIEGMFQISIEKKIYQHIKGKPKEPATNLQTISKNIYIQCI